MKNKNNLKNILIICLVLVIGIAVGIVIALNLDIADKLHPSNVAYKNATKQELEIKCELPKEIAKIVNEAPSYAISTKEHENAFEFNVFTKSGNMVCRKHVIQSDKSGIITSCKVTDYYDKAISAKCALLADDSITSEKNTNHKNYTNVVRKYNCITYNTTSYIGQELKNAIASIKTPRDGVIFIDYFID
ncbi:MAG: hypothetical protein RR594_02995 [Clostridia bacterium]